jgi:uncharacterized radical SAM superfamily protein
MADIILPDPGTDFEYVKVPKRKEQIILLQEQRDKLKVELDLMVRPTNEEVLEIFKFLHPYYEKQRELEIIKIQINSIK